MIQFLGTEDGRSMTTFYYCSVNHQSGLQSNTFSKSSYIFFSFEVHNQGIVKATVSGVFEDLKFKISEGSNQN